MENQQRENRTGDEDQKMRENRKWKNEQGNKMRTESKKRRDTK